MQVFAAPLGTDPDDAEEASASASDGSASAGMLSICVSNTARVRPVPASAQQLVFTE